MFMRVLAAHYPPLSDKIRSRSPSAADRPGPVMKLREE
jgi:hypothetical protein